MLGVVVFTSVARLYSEGILSTKEFRKARGIALVEASIDARFQPVRLDYERLTGVPDCHHSAVMPDRISLYGPPCEYCRRLPYPADVRIDQSRDKLYSKASGISCCLRRTADVALRI